MPLMSPWATWSSIATFVHTGPIVISAAWATVIARASATLPRYGRTYASARRVTRGL